LHALETHADGTTSFASARLDSWHRLGTVTRDAMTAEQALDLAYLSGWNVRKVGGLHTFEMSKDGVTRLESPDEFFTVRDNPKTRAAERLGTVGTKYEPVQNEEHCELLNLLVDESGGHFETAGSLYGGKRVFVTMKLPRAITIAGVDDVEMYLAGFNSHDGSSGFRFNVSPTRVVCGNTQRVAMANAVSQYTVRHTSGAKGKIAEARKALNMVWDYAEEFEREAERMINATATLGQLEAVLDALWPLKPNPSTQTLNNHRARKNTVVMLFENAATQANIRGTWWAIVQAIYEYLEHYAPAKTDELRAHRILTSSDVKKKMQKAYDLFSLAA
jgi:phage/plasmid-like protein (TIGR03299 family)